MMIDWKFIGKLLTIAMGCLGLSTVHAGTLIDTGVDKSWKNYGAPVLDESQWLAALIKIESSATITAVETSSTPGSYGGIRLAFYSFVDNAAPSRPGGPIFEPTPTGLPLFSENGVFESGRIRFDNFRLGLSAGSYWVAFEPFSTPSFQAYGGSLYPAIDRLIDLAWTNADDGQRKWVNFRTDPGFGDSNINLMIEGAVVSSAVPEPSTWAFLILGFGFVGTQIRQRERRLREVPKSSTAASA